MDLADTILGKSIPECSSVFGVSLLPSPPAEEPGIPRYLEFPDKGISIVLDENDVATTVQLWPDGIEAEYREYKGELPAGLSFRSSRSEARSKLGAPEKFNDGEPGEGVLGGYLYPWDRFHVGRRKVHFEYAENCSSIRLVSISLA